MDNLKVCILSKYSYILEAWSIQWYISHMYVASHIADYTAHLKLYEHCIVEFWSLHANMNIWIEKVPMQLAIAT